MILGFLLPGDGFLDNDWRDVVAVGTVAVTAIGLAGAVIAAWRAGSAATAARDTVAKNVRLGDVSTATVRIDEIIAYFDANLLQASTIRLKDLRGVLVQIRENGEYDRGTNRSFQKHLTQLTFIQTEFLTKEGTDSYELDRAAIHANLSELSDFLNALAMRSKVT